MNVVLDLQSFSWWPPSVQTHGLIQSFCCNTWYIPCGFFFSLCDFLGFFFAVKLFELPIFIFSMRNDKNSFQFVLPSSSSFTCQQTEIWASIMNAAVYVWRLYSYHTACPSWMPRLAKLHVLACHGVGSCCCRCSLVTWDVPVVQIILLKRWALILVGPVHSLKRTDRSLIFNNKSTMTVFFFFLNAC